MQVTKKPYDANKDLNIENVENRLLNKIIVQVDVDVQLGSPASINGLSMTICSSPGKIYKLLFVQIVSLFNLFGNGDCFFTYLTIFDI